MSVFIEPVFRQSATRPAQWAVVFAVLVTGLGSGCRAIRQHVEARPNIAARKLSREGLEAMHEQRWDEAEEQFKSALELNDADDRAHWGLAEALWQRGERAMAIEHMERAVRLSASDPQLLVRMGRMYLDVSRIEDAAKASTESLRGGRDLASTWALRADVLAAQGRDEASLAAYHRALVIEPNYPQVQIAIADLYHRHGRYDRSLATLDRLQDTVESDACPIRVQYLRGLAMNELGRPREAADCFAAVAERQPNDPEILLRLAEAEFAAGNRPAAMNAAQRVLQLEGSSSAAQSLMARINQAQPTLAR